MFHLASSEIWIGVRVSEASRTVRTRLVEEYG
jgi:hypothetical protein